MEYDRRIRHELNKGIADEGGIEKRLDYIYNGEGEGEEAESKAEKGRKEDGPVTLNGEEKGAGE